MMRKLFLVKGVKVYAFNRIDSTNNEAVRRIKHGISLPALFIAKSQTVGKGTRGRSFYSSGGGLYMSLALKTDDIRIQKLTILAAVATAQSIEKLTGKEVDIKWVNDIYLGGKKICGILCERVQNETNDKTLGVVIGIGVNLTVKDFPEEIKDIAANLGNINRNKLAREITKRITSLLSSNEDFMEYYKSKSILLGKEVSYIQNGVIHNGTALDIDTTGALIVKENRETAILTSGDVTLLK